MAHPKNPHFGVRFHFVRQESNDLAAKYNLEVDFAEKTEEYQCELTTEQVRWQGTPETQPDWIKTYIDFYCKQLQRSFKKDGNWPKRLRQWKESKEPNS